MPMGELFFLKERKTKLDHRQQHFDDISHDDANDKQNDELRAHFVKTIVGFALTLYRFFYKSNVKETKTYVRGMSGDEDDTC